MNAVLSTDPTDEMVEAFEQTFYRSTLTVTGNLPGVYQYSVINRATPDLVTDSINMEGIINVTCGETTMHQDSYVLCMVHILSAMTPATM